MVCLISIYMFFYWLNNDGVSEREISVGDEDKEDRMARINEREMLTETDEWSNVL